MMRTFKFCSLSNFEICNETIVAKLYITSQDLFMLQLKLLPFDPFHQFHLFPTSFPLATTNFLSVSLSFYFLGSMEFVFLSLTYLLRIMPSRSIPTIANSKISSNFWLNNIHSCIDEHKLHALMNTSCIHLLDVVNSTAKNMVYVFLS